MTGSDQIDVAIVGGGPGGVIALYYARQAPIRRPPVRAACQLPDQSTIVRVRPSLTNGSRPRGARSFASFPRRRPRVRFSPANRHRQLNRPCLKSGNNRPRHQFPMAYPTVRAPRDRIACCNISSYFLPRRSAPKWQSAEKRCAGHEPLGKRRRSARQPLRPGMGDRLSN
jgi:hypothetical protein